MGGGGGGGRKKGWVGRQLGTGGLCQPWKLYVKCQNSIVCNQFTIYSVVIVTCINNSKHKLISSVDIHSDVLLMQNYFTL